MLNLPLEEHSCGSCEKCLENSYWAELNRWRCLFLRAEQGQVAVLFALVIFLGMSFVGIALDYGRYVAGKEKIRSFMDQTATRGAGACRRYFLIEKQKPGVNFNTALQEGIRYARDESARHMQQQVSRTFRGTDLWIDEYTNVTYDVKPLLKPNGPSPNQDYCSVAITYRGRVATTFSGLFGVKEWQVPGRVVALSTLSDGSVTNLHIDFLIDVSGSMSTIANPADRDLMMAITNSKENIDRNVGNGCIYVCHHRRALLPGPMSERIINFINGTPSSMAKTIYYSTRYGQYDGGSATATLRKKAGASLRTFRNTSAPSNCNTPGGGSGLCTTNNCNPPAKPGEVCTNTNERLLMLDDVLKYFNIRLKSDELFDNIRVLVTSLLKVPNKNGIKLGFHKFSSEYVSGGVSSTVKTFVPFSSDFNSSQLLDLSSFQLTNLKFEDFDYDIPNQIGTVQQPRLFPENLNGDFAVYAPVSGLDSVSLAALPNSEKKGVLPNSVAPGSEFSKALREMTAKVRSRPPVNKDTARAVVLVTDGLVNLGTSMTLNPSDCQALKDDGVMVLVVHSYYRFQPGHSEMLDQYRKLSRKTDSLMRGNIDASEKLANEGGLKEALSACASANSDPKPGDDPKYYFPAFDSDQLAETFEALLASLLSIGKKEPPVLVTH